MVSAEAQERITIDFYTETVELQFDAGLPAFPPTAIHVPRIQRFLDQMEKKKTRRLLESFESARTRLELNDFLFLELIEQGIEAIYEPDYFQKQLLVYYYLNQLDYKVRLAYWEESLYIYGVSESDLYQVPFIVMGNEKYYNLTVISDQTLERVNSVFLLENDGNTGKPFSFDLQRWPQLRADSLVHHLNFQYLGDSIRIPLVVDKNVSRILADHPLLEEKAYFEIPLSSLLRETLVPELKKITKGKTYLETTKLLLHITRSCFRYEKDDTFFGKSKPMAAEEVFIYDRSDCEDRSALFFQLAKALLDVPMVVLAYPEHVTVGIALEGIGGEHIMHNSIPYYICDPTGPVNSTAMGQFPEGYREKAYEILHAYR